MCQFMSHYEIDKLRLPASYPPTCQPPLVVYNV